MGAQRKEKRPNSTVGWGFHNRKYGWGFPGGLAVRLWCFHCHGPGLIPGRGTEILTSCMVQLKKKSFIVIITFNPQNVSFNSQYLRLLQELALS